MDITQFNTMDQLPNETYFLQKIKECINEKLRDVTKINLCHTDGYIQDPDYIEHVDN